MTCIPKSFTSSYCDDREYKPYIIVVHYEAESLSVVAVRMVRPWPIVVVPGAEGGWVVGLADVAHISEEARVPAHCVGDPLLAAVWEVHIVLPFGVRSVAALPLAVVVGEAVVHRPVEVVECGFLHEITHTHRDATRVSKLV